MIKSEHVHLLFFLNFPWFSNDLYRNISKYTEYSYEININITIEIKINIIHQKKQKKYEIRFKLFKNKKLIKRDMNVKYRNFVRIWINEAFYILKLMLFLIGIWRKIKKSPIKLKLNDKIFFWKVKNVVFLLTNKHYYIKTNIIMHIIHNIFIFFLLEIEIVKNSNLHLFLETFRNKQSADVYALCIYRNL